MLQINTSFNLSFLLTTLLLIFCFSANAEIYTAISIDGVQKWATQPQDSTYHKTSIIEFSPSVATSKMPGEKSKFITKTTSASRLSLKPLILSISNKYDVSPELVEALIEVESGFNTNAISPKGARGLMQLMPATARSYGMKNVQELHIPALNLDMGVRHLKDLLNLHGGQLVLAIASYNAGQGAIAKSGQRIPRYQETMLYVPAVLAHMAQYSEMPQASKAQ